jgi:hypothetical protein
MTGADRAQAQPDTGFHGAADIEGAEPDWLGPARIEPEGAAPAAEGQAPASGGARLLGALLLILAAAWIGAAGWSIWQARPELTLPNAVGWIATLSGPLVLIALLWLLLGRSSRRETQRFTRAVEAMRTESTALESVLAIVSTRIEENHARLRGEAEKLMSLGDEASDRLGRVTHYLSKETASLDGKSAALESAAAAATVDIGVLLTDLPRAEEQARAVAQAMKDAGLAAHGQAGALEAQLAAITARGREADELLGGAAQRMAAHVARIESSSSTAATSIGEASTGMTEAVDAAMSRAAEAVDAARTSLETQAAAMLAAIEHSRAALDRAGEDAARNLSQRIDSISEKIQALAGHLSAQDAASHALVTGLAKELADLDGWFDRLGATGTEQSERLTGSVAAIREGTRALIEELGGGREEAGALIERGRELAQIFTGVGSELEVTLPSSLENVEAQAQRAALALSELAPQVAAAEGSAAGLENRIAGVAAQADRIAQTVELQEAASRGLVAELIREADGLQARFTALTESGDRETERLGQGLAALRSAAGELQSELASGGEQAGAFGGRAEALAGTLREIAGQLDQALPAALAQVEAQAVRSREAAEAIRPVVGEVQASADSAAARIGEAEAGISRQREALEQLLARIGEGTATADEQLRGLGAAAAEANEAAAKLASSTGPELVEALVRVREAANQAAERAREAIAAVIPASAASLGDASREALARAVSETVGEQLSELSDASQRALDTARGASQRLTRQMLALGETAAAIERRIDDARREREEKESDSLSRRVALLIESLNSTAIDVTKILSNEVTDSAWAAYLKGDRGVFTRRAVRLLENSEAKEIARHYDEEPEFREQVNRYIHDFEGMLRRILADRDGSPLGVTILSSDMGKLYVALAQAIERLR